MMKFTKKVALEVAINAIENSTLPNWSFTEGEETLSISKAEAIEKLQKMIEQLESKSNTPKKPTKVQEANEGVKGVILATLQEIGKPVTITELMASNEELSPTKISAQKVSSLVTQMVKSSALVRTEEKRKAYFSVAQG